MLGMILMISILSHGFKKSSLILEYVPKGYVNDIYELNGSFEVKIY